MIDYSAQSEGVEQAGVSHGQEAGALRPAGWYPWTVVGAEVSATKKGVPQARMRLRVNDGAPNAGRQAFINFNLGYGNTKMVGEDEIHKTPEELKETKDFVQKNINGLLAALFETPSYGTPTAPGTSLDFVKEKYKVAQWEGRQFMGRIAVQESEQYGESNQLKEFYAMNDPKRGLAAWQGGAWGRAKLEAAIAKEKSAQGGGVGGSQGVTL